MSIKQMINRGFYKEAFMQNMNPPEYSNLMAYIIVHCDNSGLWIPNFNEASMDIHIKVDKAIAEKAFKGRFIDLGDHWLMIDAFRMLHPKNIGALCNPQYGVFSDWLEAGLEYWNYPQFFRQTIEAFEYRYYKLDKSKFEKEHREELAQMIEEDFPFSEHLVNIPSYRKPLMSFDIPEESINDTQTEHTGIISEPSVTCNPQSFKADSVELMNNFEEGGKSSTLDKDYTLGLVRQYPKDVSDKEIADFNTTCLNTDDFKNRKKQIEEHIKSVSETTTQSFILWVKQEMQMPIEGPFPF